MPGWPQWMLMGPVCQVSSSQRKDFLLDWVFDHLSNDTFLAPKPNDLPIPELELPDYCSKSNLVYRGAFFVNHYAL